MTDILKTDNKEFSTENLETGQIVQTDEGVYIFDGSELKKVNGDLNLSLYDMNKQIISQLPAYTPKQLEEAKDLIVKYITDYQHKDEYYMLLCHDIHYFTVFVRHTNPKENIEDALLDCINNVGDIKSIEYSSDEQALEIWVTDPNGESYAMYFFDYGRGIVLCQ